MDHATEVNIDAEPGDVWSVLVDVERWPEWTESMSRVQLVDGGPLGLGSRVRIKQPGFPAAVWRVTELEPGRSFSWEAAAGGVRSVADHRLTPSEGGTRVTLAIRQSGVLATLLQPFFVRRVRRYVAMEADGLKRRCESPTA